MEEKQINANESLEIITKMISNTQEKWERNGGTPSLIWGYATVFVSLLIWSLYKFCGITDMWLMYLWFLIPALGTIFMTIFKKKTEKGYTTIIDKVVNYVWITLGIACGVVSIATFLLPIPILFSIVLMIGIGVTITGLVTKMKVFTICGIIGGILSFACLIIEGLDCCLIFAALFVLICIIPGHVLNCVASKKSK